jgi:DNA polymerase III delta prime subunit
MYLSFFEDKPNLDEIDFKNDLLKKYSKNQIDSLNNIIFYGVQGSGKTIKVYAFLCSLLDNRVYDLKNLVFEEDAKSIQYKASIFHIEIDALELLTNEKLFFNNFLKNYCITRNIGLNLPKIVYIKNADNLNKFSYIFLRKVIEKNYMTCKFIFEMRSLSGIIDSLLSRFLLVKIKMPEEDEILNCLINYTKRKEINIDIDILQNIIIKSQKISHHNLKNIFGFLRYYIITGKYFNFFYDQSLNNIIDIIFEKNIKMSHISLLKDIIEDMFVNIVNSDEILNIIFYNILNRITNYKYNNDIDNKIKIDLTIITVKHQNNMVKGNKEFIHILNYILELIDYLRSNSYV